MSSTLRDSLLAAQLLFLHRRKGPLEKLIVQNVALAILSSDDPIAGLCVGEPKIGSDCF
jgi:hypothetical protein